MKKIFFAVVLGFWFMNVFAQGTVDLKLSKPKLYPFGIKSIDPSMPVLVDIDHDGDLDLFGLKANIGIGGGKIYFRENTGTDSKPVFAKPVINPFGLKSKDLATPVFVDIDNDGDLDMFGLKDLSKLGIRENVKGGRIYFRENVGTPSKPEFAEPVMAPFGIKTKDLDTPVFVDIDNDGDLDLFGLKAASGEGGRVYFMENIGTKSKPQFAKPVFAPFGIKTKDLSAPTLVDIDHDGDLDLFGVKSLFSGGGRVYFMENTGSRTKPEFAAPVYKPFGIKYKCASAPVFVDIDNDGDLDMFGFEATFGGGIFYYRENKAK